MSANVRDIHAELRTADEERAAQRAKMVRLTATVLDRTLSMEQRLAAHMAIDNIIWTKRTVAHDFVGNDDEPDAGLKIQASRKASDRRRNIRARAERIAAGLRVRPLKNFALGVWKSKEGTDHFGKPDICAVCGHGFDTWARPRSVTCSPKCARALRKARRN